LTELFNIIDKLSLLLFDLNLLIKSLIYSFLEQKIKLIYPTILTDDILCHFGYLFNVFLILI